MSDDLLEAVAVPEETPSPIESFYVNGLLLHKYFKSVWKLRYKPYCACAFKALSFDPKTRKFTIQVLYDQRELAVTSDYPVIPISEDEAQKLVEHRSAFQTATTTANTTTMSNETPLSNDAAKGGDTATETKPKKERAPRGDGRTAIRQIALPLIAEGKPNKEILAVVKLTYPEKDDKSITGLISLYKYQEKKKLKEAGNSAPPEPTPEPTPEPVAG